MEKLQSLLRLGQRAEKAKDVFSDEELVDQDVLNISNQCSICSSSISENEQLKEKLAEKEAEIFVLKNQINELENKQTQESSTATTLDSSTQTVQTNSELQNLSVFATQGAISKENRGRKRHSSDKSGIKPFSSKNSTTHTYHTLDLIHGPYGRFQAPLKSSPPQKPSPPPPAVSDKSYPVLKQMKCSSPHPSVPFLSSAKGQNHPDSVMSQALSSVASSPPLLSSILSNEMAPSPSLPQTGLPTTALPLPKSTWRPSPQPPSSPIHQPISHQSLTQSVPFQELSSDSPPGHSLSPKPTVPAMSESQFSCPKDKAKKVFIYGDSNYQTRHRQLRQKIRELQPDGTEKYDLNFIRSYTLKKTLVEMKNHDHNDAIVVIATLTNNIRYNQSLTTIRGLQEQIIKELKRETDQNNIVFLACPPTRSPANFDTYMSNCYTEVVCEREGVRFAESLVKEEHLYWRDGIHVDYEHQDVVTRSAAAAIINSSV